MSRTRRLGVVLLLNVGLVTALMVVGLSAHSLAVLAAGADYLADAAAIGVSLLAIWITAQPRGYPKATTVAALVNAGWLLILNIAIIVAAIQRLAAGAHHVDGLPVLIVSAIAAIVMLAGALILGGDADDDDGTEDLNVRAVLLDTTGDAAAAAGVAVSGAIILGVGGWYWLDPAVALVIAVIIGYQALKLTRKITAALRPRDPDWISTRLQGFSRLWHLLAGEELFEVRRCIAVAFDVCAVAVVLPVLGEQDERGGVGGLGGERQVEQDKRVRVPVVDDPDHVERDPADDVDGLPGYVPASGSPGAWR